MNFRKLCRIACVFILLMCVQGNALAATIHGTVYEWYSFKPLENSIVEINSTPEQYFVATDAEYSFNLTPGTYLITANYFEGDIRVYKAEEEFTISDEGEYVHDLLLFPTYQEDLLDQGRDFDNVDLNFENAEPQSQASSQNMVLTFALLALCILLLTGYFVIKGKRNPPEKAAGFPGITGNLNVSEPNASEPNASEPNAPEPNAPEPNASEPNASEPNASKPNASEPENFTIEIKTSGYVEPSKAGSIEVSETDYEPPAPLNVAERTGAIYKTGMSMQQNVKLPEDSNVSIDSSSEDEFDLLSPGDLETSETSLPDDLKEILNLIRANGNRITQRELRKKSPYSESKVSLMLSDLEERGLVEKFKRGRGNIIRIPDGEAIKQAGPQSRKESGGNGTS